MKRVVITGKDSYIGNHIQEWLEKSPAQYMVEQLDVRTGNWKKYDFSGVDTIVHVAGIVHHPEITDWNLYKKVNADLPFEIASIAKKSGVKQFIFMSTMAVYGCVKRLTENIITDESKLIPLNAYEKSKLIAENNLKHLEDCKFKVVVVRPPNVYGKGCKGGYISGFKSVVSKLPAIPSAFTNVKQSMLYIDNLSEFIRLAIVNEISGTFMPQDKCAVSAVELMTQISIGIEKKKRKSELLGLGIYALQFLPIVNKAYGGVAYDENMSAYFGNSYVVVPFEEGIRRTVSDE